MADAIHAGVVGRGFGMASGASVGHDGNPYPASTLVLQQPHFLARGIDLDALVRGRAPGTINIVLEHELVLGTPDLTARLVDWTAGIENPAGRIGPETFSFVRCRLEHGGRDYAAIVYYPHPETKPSVNAHRYDVLEVIAPPVAGLAMGDAVRVVCRADAFMRRDGSLFIWKPVAQSGR